MKQLTIALSAFAFVAVLAIAQPAHACHCNKDGAAGDAKGECPHAKDGKAKCEEHAKAGGDCACKSGGECKCGKECKCGEAKAAGGECKCGKAGSDCKCGGDCKCGEGECSCAKGEKATDAKKAEPAKADAKKTEPAKADAKKSEPAKKK
ncbi:MAG: hypothetical protein QM765_16265 [Myxococcales bacterium]